MREKVLKDPVYGYITIPFEYINNVIDKDSFQRLRRIVQTSYSPLYPSSLHNRFSHSIGVFNLGTIACKALVSSIEDILQDTSTFDLAHLSKVFLLACLLHDVGHAPFSHTGEKYFLDNSNETKRYAKLHEKLIQCVEDTSFEKDIPVEESQAAAAHEIMSAIIGIQNFDNGAFFTSAFDKAFFARCITGYRFKDDYGINSIYNCFISLLNSKVIDVDRLDYLLRDAYFTGFETVSIDYSRLLSSVRVVENRLSVDEQVKIRYELVYDKNAISIIENVVYAHDSERKWIQTHPTVLYEMYIMQHIMSSLDKSYSDGDQALFSQKALGPEGVELNNGVHVSLLCDDDIVHLLKANTKDGMYKEFFSRDSRRHPLWKSESEYKAFLSLQYGGITLDRLENAFELTEKYLIKNTDSWVITEEVIQKIDNELAQIEENASKAGVDQKTLESQRNAKRDIQTLMKCLRDYAKSVCDCECDFVILKASQFYSGFNKRDFEKIRIVFASKVQDRVCDFGEVVSTLNGTNDSQKEFFYLFCKLNRSQNFQREELCKLLYQAFM